MADINSVWATTVTRFEIQLETMTLALHLRALDDGAVTLYKLLIDEVSDLRLTNDIEVPWAYAELSEAHAERREDGRWDIELIIWDEACTLACTCAAYTVAEVSSASSGPAEAFADGERPPSGS